MVCGRDRAGEGKERQARNGKLHRGYRGDEKGENRLGRDRLDIVGTLEVVGSLGKEWEATERTQRGWKGAYRTQQG